MNKYQEALDYAKKHLDSKQDIKKIGVLKKLVDKATPKKAKPMYLPLVFTPYRCPCCGTLVRSEIEKFNYCHNCGQAIDWSDEDVEQRKVSEYENPQPYKLEDLKVGMWVWDDKNEMFILITFIDKQFKKMHFFLTEYDGFNDEYVNVEYTEYFEEGRFLPITKALEYQK